MNRYFVRLPHLICLNLLLGLALASPVAAESMTLSPQDRRNIDEHVLNLPDPRTEEPKKTFYGTLAGWSVSRTPMNAKEEKHRGEFEHQKILQTWKTSPAPQAAEAVLKRLTAKLPAVTPREFRFRLTIVETPEFRSWTTGAGFLYMSRPMFESLVTAEDGAEDRLAFVLAHEMGHVVRKHCRRGYQLLRLQSFAKKEGLDESQLSKLRQAIERTVDRTGNRLRFLYEPHQEYQADAFANHLCRNAGFDREAAWDLLRAGVITEMADADLSRDPAAAMISRNKGSKRPSAGDRLRQLCWERDGIVRESAYGFWEFDPRADQWIKPKNLRVKKSERLIVLVHGMDSALTKCYRDLARALKKDASLKTHRVLGFQFPGDAGLARSGEFLHREIQRVVDPSVRPIFVAHSAGGLVVRYHIEVKGGAFERVILQGTPNQGSDWAKLRSVIEIRQFVKDLREGYSQAIENAILDGQGQIAHDLQPGSLHLNFLNQREYDRSNYHVIRGRRYSGTRMVVLGNSLRIGRSLLERKVEASDMPSLLRERALRTLDKFELPEEVRRGDLLVSTESADLEGVSSVETFKLSHGKLSRHPQTIAKTLEILNARQN